MLDRPNFAGCVGPSCNDPTLRGLIAQRGVGIVYDIGARVGQFGMALRRRGYTGLIVSFEPQSSNYAALVQVAAADGAWDCFHCALGSSSGQFLPYSQLTYIKPTSDHIQLGDPKPSVQPEESVQFHTLDWVVGTMRLFISTPSLIKIDARGFEREVLKGARRALTKAAGVLVEAPIDDGRCSAWSFSEAEQYFANLGFSPCQVDRVDRHLEHPAPALTTEWLFEQKPEGAERRPDRSFLPIH